MVQFRDIPTIFLKVTKKSTGVNVALDIKELKKVPNWIKDKKDGQELRQFFLNFARINDDGEFEPLDKPKLYEVYNDDEEYPEEVKEPETEDDVPF